MTRDRNSAPYSRVPRKVLHPHPTRLWLLRKQAADFLEISPAYLRELAQESQIRTLPDAKGRERFDPKSLIAIKGRLDESRKKKGIAWARSPGDLSAEAFLLFNQGADLRRVVTELRIVAEDAKKLQADWLEIGGDLVLRAAEVEELRDLLDWREATAASLVQSVGRRLRAQFARGQQTILDEHAAADKQHTEGIPRGKDRDEDRTSDDSNGRS